MLPTENMRVIIAGGGTGGLVIPALAIAYQLKKQFDAEILFIGTARGIETRLVPKAGFPLELIKVGGLKNVSLMTRAKTIFDLPRALWVSGRMLNDFRPDVVIGVGGYASGPAMFAAIRRSPSSPTSFPGLPIAWCRAGFRPPLCTLKRLVSTSRTATSPAFLYVKPSFGSSQNPMAHPPCSFSAEARVPARSIRR